MTPTDVIDLLKAGKFTDIHDLFVPQLRPLVPAEAIQAAWTAALTEHGALADVGAASTDQGVTRIPLTFERGRQTLVMMMNGDGQLGSLQLAPASAAEPITPWQHPSYVDTSSFEEQEITLGSGALAVAGTLSRPRRPGPFPAVVLLSGSGAHDRDETIGRNKPFKDLAWGLASRGVAVLRFDKVTHAHPAEVAKDPDFTVTDEYAPAALAAVHLLREHEAINRIFLLGHSLGGTAAPRIAAQEPQIAGLVLLAAGAQPLHWAAVRQLRYLASLNPAASGVSEATIEAITQQAEKVDSPDLSPGTPSTDLPFGIPAPYWLDLRAYDAPAAAATLNVPIFLAQGGRDYQVTATDDLARWQAELADRPHVTIRVYDADNHLFFSGTGQPTPTEYEPAQHMDPQVVADIAEWVSATPAIG
jgi:dienelactone hydrolase